jgi:hypothetical protein
MNRATFAAADWMTNRATDGPTFDFHKISAPVAHVAAQVAAQGDLL